MGAALVYAWDMLDAARGGANDDNTNGLMHLPMQAAFGLAVTASAVVAAVSLANGVTGWWFAFVPAALSAVWFGVVARAYPDHLGSIGQVGAIPRDRLGRWVARCGPGNRNAHPWAGSPHPCVTKCHTG